MKLGVFLANSKTRRARLTTDQLQQLAALGLDWAKTTQTQTETETAETVPPAFCSGTAWSCC
ncbi:hypothetical protein [Streptomyces sp. NRRL S-31]|uniref:hypothetical protein n=1 Tax=Streptomyces sp. NRRL S-31 TaxID=1463898 RepID=UPI000B28E745|nr:hypothetical protein [Streptomyces sp. NRRL S-31]